MGPDNTPVMMSCVDHLLFLQNQVDSKRCTEESAAKELRNIAKRLIEEANRIQRKGKS